MTYIHRVINDRPENFFPLDDSFYDYIQTTPAGINKELKPMPSLVVGGGQSYLFDSDVNFSFSSTCFHEQSPQKTFSLECWFKPVEVSGPKRLISHRGQNDGLWFDGEYIHFTTLHENAGACTASYSPSSTAQSFHVVGVHTGSKNELYVNGVRVSFADLTEEQSWSKYSIPQSPGTLFVGQGSGSVIIDSPAVYSQALTSRTAKLHFLWGRDAQSLRTIVSNRGGEYWTFTDESAEVLFELKFDTTEDWRTGETTSVNISEDTLSPIFDENEVSVAGSWRAGLILESLTDRINGSKIEWDSDGPVVVQTSTNGGASWTTAKNGQEVPNISSLFSTAGGSLEIRVNLPADEPLDTVTKMKSMSIKFYTSRSSTANVSDRQASFTGNMALATDFHEPIEHSDNFGLYLYNATSDIKLESAKTIEFWLMLMKDPGVDNYIFQSKNSSPYLKFSGSQWSTSTNVKLYVNGTPRAGAAIEIVPHTWTHIVATFSSANSSTLTLGDRSLPIRMGMYADYRDRMSADEVKNSYNSYLGIPHLRFSEDMNLSITDPGSSGIKIYNYPWTLKASG